MLERLEVHGSGPVDPLKLEFGPRLNIFTGDNGLGKTFALDVAWWALTQTWPGYPAMPKRAPNGTTPKIDYLVRRESGSWGETAFFDFSSQAWLTGTMQAGFGPLEKDQELVLYARVDGGFTVWDPLRASTEAASIASRVRRPAYQFSADEVWNGLHRGSTVLCNGLIRDWITWQLQQGEAFSVLAKVLATLSPNESETIRPGAKTMRMSVEHVLDIPTIDLPYGNVPIVHAAAGMRRVLSFAYLLTWMWREHLEAAQLKMTAPRESVTIIVDEIEAHLHPQWQRVILPSLLEAIRVLKPTLKAVQILATTHAPLVLASLEPAFTPPQDKLFHFAIEGKEVTLKELAWAKQGDIANWLVSEVFGLTQPRSKEAERAIKAANAWMRGDHDVLPTDLATREAIHAELKRVLADHDDFWPRWIVRTEAAGAGAEGARP